MQKQIPKYKVISKFHTKSKFYYAKNLLFNWSFSLSHLSFVFHNQYSSRLGNFTLLFASYSPPLVSYKFKVRPDLEIMTYKPEQVSDHINSELQTKTSLLWNPSTPSQNHRWKSRPIALMHVEEEPREKRPGIKTTLHNIPTSFQKAEVNKQRVTR